MFPTSFKSDINPDCIAAYKVNRIYVPFLWISKLGSLVLFGIVWTLNVNYVIGWIFIGILVSLFPLSDLLLKYLTRKYPCEHEQIDNPWPDKKVY